MLAIASSPVLSTIADDLRDEIDMYLDFEDSGNENIDLINGTVFTEETVTYNGTAKWGTQGACFDSLSDTLVGSFPYQYRDLTLVFWYNNMYRGITGFFTPVALTSTPASSYLNFGEGSTSVQSYYYQNGGVGLENGAYPTNDTWVMIAGAFSTETGGATIDNLYVYYSDNPADRMKSQLITKPVWSNPVQLVINGRDNNSALGLGGCFDDVMIFSKNLSETELDYLRLNHLELTPPPITNSSWNVTSFNVIGDRTGWNSGGIGFVNLSSDVLSLTSESSEATNMSCGTTNTNYSTMISQESSRKSPTTNTISHAMTIPDSLSIGENCVYCSFIKSDGTGELANSTSGCLTAFRSEVPATVNAVIFPSINFSFASTSFVTAQLEAFNTSTAQNISILSSMNIEKATLPALTRTVTGRIVVDGVTQRVENLRTVTSVGDTGSAGFSPTIITVPAGQHNISIDFRSTGVDSINIDNLDTLLIFSTDVEDNDTFSMTVQNFEGSHTSPTEFNITSWELPKSILSETFIIQRILATKTDVSDTNITYYNIDFDDTPPFTSPLIKRSISADTIGSMELSWVEDEHLINHTHNIFGIVDSTSTANVSLNGSVLLLDTRDGRNHFINHKGVSDPNTNITPFRSVSSSTNIVNDSLKMMEGDSIFIVFSVSIASTSGAQELTVTLGDGTCTNQKQRTYSDSGEVGNIFLYQICNGYSIGDNVTISADLELSGGESVEILDESMIIAETTITDISAIPSPPVPNAIINPEDGDNVAGLDTIDWLAFSDPDDDVTGYEVKLQQLAENETIIDAVGLWRFEENGGTTAFDNTTFTPNNGTHNGTPNYVASKGGNNTGDFALNFDGSTEHINYGDVHDLRDHDLSVCAWINADNIAPASTQFAVTKADTTGLDGRWGFGLLSSSVIRVLYDAGSSQAFSGATPITTAWHHVCVVYDRSDVISLYLDTALDGQSTDISGSEATDLDTDVPLMVGADNDASAQATLHWDGQIDEVMIFNRSLNQADINDIYRQGYLQITGLTFSLENVSASTTSIDVNYSEFPQDDYRINVTATDSTGFNASSFIDVTLVEPLIDILLISPPNSSLEDSANVTFEYNVSRNSTCDVFFNNTLNGSQTAFNNQINVYSSFFENGTYVWNVSCSNAQEFSGVSGQRFFDVGIVPVLPPAPNPLRFGECPDDNIQIMLLYIFIFLIGLFMIIGTVVFRAIGLGILGSLIMAFWSFIFISCNAVLGYIFVVFSLVGLLVFAIGLFTTERID